MDVQATVDMHGEPIVVGAQVLAPFSKGGAGDAAHMVNARVVAITPPRHHGYGYMSHGLTLETRDGTRMHHRHPRNCLVLGR